MPERRPDRPDAGVDVTPTDTGLIPGTRVLTPTGERAVEALAPGDLVIAVSGTAAPFQAVVALRRVAIAGQLLRIRAGALADGAPLEDLVLPGGHALLLDGTLVQAGMLLDGRGIVEEAAPQGQEAIALVLAGHDAVLAEGAAVETALPTPDDVPCAPRVAPDGALRALLDWRAEAMGWAPAGPMPGPPPAIGTRRERLAAGPLSPVAPPEWPLRPPR